MEIILSFSAQIGFERVINGETVLDNENWLSRLIKKLCPDKYMSDCLKYLGRDAHKRIELSIPFHVFECLKSDPFFIIKAETLRRVRCSGPTTLLEHLIYASVSPFDNDLDNLNK